MHSPIVPQFRQGFAQLTCCAAIVVVRVNEDCHSFPHAGLLSHRPRLCESRICRDCTPFPFTRPAPLRGGSGLSGAMGHARTTADRRNSVLEQSAFFFQDRGRAVELAATTTQRGIEPCVNISSSLHLRPPPFRAACPPRPSAAWPAPLPVLPSRTPLMRTWSRAQPLARLPVRPLAACRACRPAVATDLTAAFGRPVATTVTTNTRPSGHAAPVAFVMPASRPGCGGRGERCSRRS